MSIREEVYERQGERIGCVHKEHDSAYTHRQMTSVVAFRNFYFLRVILGFRPSRQGPEP